MRKIPFLLGTFLFALAITTAQVPPTFNFQGRLLDERNEPIKGTTNVTIQIWDAATGGNKLYEESFNINSTDGFFNVVLGKNSNIDVTKIDGRKQLWYQMIIGAGSTQERIMFNSIPYSVGATHADTARVAGAAKPIGTAGGMLAGTYPNPTFNVPVADTSKNLLIMWNAASNPKKWEYVTPNSIMSVSLTDKAVPYWDNTAKSFKDSPLRASTNDMTALSVLAYGAIDPTTNLPTMPTKPAADSAKVLVTKAYVDSKIGSGSGVIINAATNSIPYVFGTGSNKSLESSPLVLNGGANTYVSYKSNGINATTKLPDGAIGDTVLATKGYVDLRATGANIANTVNPNTIPVKANTGDNFVNSKMTVNSTTGAITIAAPTSTTKALNVVGQVTANNFVTENASKVTASIISTSTGSVLALGTDVNVEDIGHTSKFRVDGTGEVNSVNAYKLRDYGTNDILRGEFSTSTDGTGLIIRDNSDPSKIVASLGYSKTALGTYVPANSSYLVLGKTGSSIPTFVVDGSTGAASYPSGAAPNYMPPNADAKTLATRGYVDATISDGVIATFTQANAIFEAGTGLNKIPYISLENAGVKTLSYSPLSVDGSKVIADNDFIAGGTVYAANKNLSFGGNGTTGDIGLLMSNLNADSKINVVLGKSGSSAFSGFAIGSDLGASTPVSSFMVNMADNTTTINTKTVIKNTATINNVSIGGSTAKYINLNTTSKMPNSTVENEELASVGYVKKYVSDEANNNVATATIPYVKIDGGTKSLESSPLTTNGTNVTASGNITAATLTSTGLLTANSGLTVNGEVKVKVTTQTVTTTTEKLARANSSVYVLGGSPSSNFSLSLELFNIATTDDGLTIYVVNNTGKVATLISDQVLTVGIPATNLSIANGQTVQLIWIASISKWARLN